MYQIVHPKSQTVRASFLALLDYVSRAHEIAICKSSIRVAIISESELNARISFKF